jgi:hypothetical protein
MVTSKRNKIFFQIFVAFSSWFGNTDMTQNLFSRPFVFYSFHLSCKNNDSVNIGIRKLRWPNFAHY